MQTSEVAGVGKGKGKEKQREETQMSEVPGGAKGKGKQREKGPDRGRYIDEEVLAMGHDDKEIKLFGGRIVHPNPLRSNPVD